MGEAIAEQLQDQAAQIIRLRAELAEAKARIAELEAAGNRLGDAAVEGALTSIEAVTELAEAKARIAELEAALEHNNSALDGANAIIKKLEADTFERWKRCPSTHCERRGECASPHECIIKPKPPELEPVKDARIAEQTSWAIGSAAANEMLRKRIAELEAAGNRLGDAAIAGILDGRDRAERAEARIAELESGAAEYAYELARTEIALAIARAEAERDRERLLRKLYEDAAKRWQPRAERAEAERDAMREALLGLSSAANVLLDEAMSFSVSGVYFSEKCMGHKGPDLVATAIDKASAVLNRAALNPPD